MATPEPTKPMFNKQTTTPPFKAAEEAPAKVIPRDLGKSSLMSPDGWQPIAAAPQDPQARFMVRATVNGKPIGGTETLVRYRPSRKMVGRKWQSALTIIDDRLGTKLGFRPTEWCPATREQLGTSTWDEAVAKAAAARDV